jgi:hypothetical protein
MRYLSILLVAALPLAAWSNDSRPPKRSIRVISVSIRVAFLC